MTGVLLVAKEPVAGRAKTRLHPPLSLAGAARIAELALAETVAVLNRLPFSSRTLAWEGRGRADGTDDWRVIPQVDGSFDERLAAALDACSGPTLLVGMDTPQLSAGDVAPVFGSAAWRRDAWFGPAADGGFWALGLREPEGDLVRGVPMSRDDTGALQLDRLHGAGLDVGTLATLTDIDTIEDARSVARLMPGSALARELALLVGEGAA